MVDKATLQPDYVQKDCTFDDKIKNLLIGMCIIVLFVEKLYIMNVRPPEGCGASGTALAAVTSLLSMALLWLVRANLGQKGHRQLELWWLLRLQANQVSLLSWSWILSCHMMRHTMQIKEHPGQIML